MSSVKKCKKQEKSIYQEYFDIVESSISKYGKDTIVLIMVGDFYELYEYVDENNKRFGADLGIICEITDFIKTKKNKEKESSMKNPFMTGAPIRSVSKIINKCLKRNYTIVIIEQTSPPPKPSREITQIITPSTYINEIEINNNYLMVIYIEINSALNTKKNNYSCSLTAIDVLSNELIFYEIHCDDINEALNEITRFYMFYNPIELVIYEISNSKTQTTKISNSINLKYNQCVKKYYNIDPNFEKVKYQNLVFNKVYKNDGLLSPIENLNLEKYHYSRICLVITFEYIFQRNEKLLYSINKPEYYGNSQYMTLFNNAQYQLNIIDNNTPDTNNSSYNSLNDVINHCITPMGKRYLKNRLCNPYTNYDTIQNYYDLTEKMIENGKTDNVRLLLKSVYDLQKLFRKLVIKYITPSELYKVYISLKNTLEIIVLLNETNIKPDVEKLFNNKNVEMLKESIKYLEDTFYIEKFHQITLTDLTNSIYKRGVYSDIDELQINISSGDDVLEKIAQRFREFDENIDVSIENKSKGKKEDIGYFVKTKLKPGLVLKEKLKDMGTFKLDDFCEIKYNDINFKELKSEMRMTFLKLNTQSDQITECKLKLNKLCGQYYKEDIKKWYDDYDGMFGDLLKFVVKVDYVCNNVYVSNKFHYCKPELVKSDESNINAFGLRHAIIERLIDTEYVENDIIMDEKNTAMIVFGLNSSGKSSLIKSICLAIVMAQSGLYVPCTHFKYSIFKKLMVRLSSADNLFKGQSSFVVEISELDIIFKNMDKNTLLVLDEAMRGTEVDSALSLSSSCIMYFLSKKSKFVYAGHLHKIIEFKSIKNAIDSGLLKLYHLTVEITNDNIIFNRKLKKGMIEDTCYGLKIANHIFKNESIKDMANEFKNELLQMNGYDTHLVSTKRSLYNNNMYVDGCSICGSNKDLQVHHIIEQASFINDINKNNFKVLKNDMNNIVSLCSKCHNDEHHKKLSITKKTMSIKGVVLE
jgi:DNA mismatch repair protein MutS